MSKLDWFTTGSIPLNLACSQRGISGGIPRGRITNFVGDGSSGKTLITLETCANAWANNPKSKMFPATKRITIHYNNPEEVMDFDLGLMYGDGFVEDIVWKKIPTVEECGYDIARTLKRKKSDEGIIYVVDSWDALKAEKTYDEFNKIVDKGTTKKGSYDLDKQKFGTREFFPNICELMSDIDFTLIIISQTRDKIGSMFPEKTRSGGSALNFYTHLVPWFSEATKIKQTVGGQDFIKGIISKCKVKRSKVGKAYRESETVIAFDYGVDNINSCLKYLIGDGKNNQYNLSKIPSSLEIEKYLSKEDKDLKTIDKSNLIKIIEENDLENILSNKVEEIWLSREDKIQDERKPKFLKKREKLNKIKSKTKEEASEDPKPKRKKGKKQKTSTD